MTINYCSQYQLSSEGKGSIHQHTDLNFRIRLKRFTMIADQGARHSQKSTDIRNKIEISKADWRIESSPNRVDARLESCGAGSEFWTSIFGSAEVPYTSRDLNSI